MTLAIFDQQDARILPTKFRVHCPFSSGEEAQNRFSRWRPSWISNPNDSSYFWSTSHSDTSYQVSSHLAQGCRSNDWKQIVDTARRTLTNYNSSLHEHFVLRWANTPMETLSCYSDESISATVIKNTIFVEVNVMNIDKFSWKFLLHPPYGFWGEEFWIFFCKF